MATGDSSSFTLTEQQVAFRLGMPREWVKVRRGAKGACWIYGPDRQVLWSENGVAALMAATEPAADIGGKVETAPPAEKPATVAPANDLAVLSVTWCRFANRRVMHAEDRLGNVMTVWVLDARKFHPGMKVLGRPRPGKVGVFDFAGNPDAPEAGPRMPRQTGRW